MSFLFRCFFFVFATSSTLLLGNHWTPTNQVNVAGIKSHKPSVSVDHTGVTVAVWEEPGLPTSVIKGAILPMGATHWIPTSDLSVNGVIDKALPQVQHDSKGNAIAVWLEQDGNAFVIRSSQLTPGSYDWTSFGDISEATPISKEQHRFALNAQGDAVAIWIQSYQGVNTVFGSKRLAAASNWDESILPISQLYHATSPALAIDDKGSALAVWLSFRQGTNVIAGAILPSNSDIWTGTGILGSKEPPQAPQIAMNGSGKAVAVWAEGYPQKIKVKAATFTIGGTSWVATSDVSPPLALAQQFPIVTLDPAGNTFVGYIGINGSKQVMKGAFLPQGTAIWKSTHDASKTADKIIPEAIDLSVEGNGTLVFQAVQGNTYTLKSSTLAKKAQKWMFTEDLSKPSTQALTTSTSFNSSGTATSAWSRFSSIEASFHQAVLAPTNFQGSQGMDNGVKKTWFNTLKWNPPKGTTPLHYRIFSDAALTQEITVLPGTQLTYTHINLKDSAYTYYIIAEDSFGGRSSAASVTVEPPKKTKGKISF